MYIDAGSGSMLLQIVAAGFFSVLFFYKQIILWFKKVFSRSKGSSDKK